jgi:hypothetical protein
MMMTPDRVMVWKFDSAPPELQALHSGAEAPHWVALVPAAVNRPDLHEAIVTQTRPNNVEAHRTEAGDVVYIGSSDLKQFLELVGDSRSERKNKADHG